MKEFIQVRNLTTVNIAQKAFLNNGHWRHIERYTPWKLPTAVNTVKKGFMTNFPRFNMSVLILVKNPSTAHFVPSHMLVQPIWHHIWGFIQRRNPFNARFVTRHSAGEGQEPRMKKDVIPRKDLINVIFVKEFTPAHLIENAMRRCTQECNLSRFNIVNESEPTKSILKKTIELIRV